MRQMQKAGAPVGAPSSAARAASLTSSSSYSQPAQKTPARKRAHALFYDDTPENFAGAGPKGKHPNIICARLTTALTVVQLTQALELHHHQEANLKTDPNAPTPFFFFDFDGTLSLADGLLQVESGSGSLDRLFGSAERRRTLQLTVGTLLQAGRCYVLTANGMVWRVAEALNALLASGGAGRGFEARFVLEDTIRYTPAGTKLKTIEEIISSRGFVLCR